MDTIPSLPVYGFEPNLGGLLSLAITVLLPILVGLITRQSTSAGAKAVLLLVLAAIKTVLEAWLQAENTSATFEWVPIVYTTAINFGIAVTLHFGLFKPTGVAQAAQNSVVTDGQAGSRRADDAAV